LKTVAAKLYEGMFLVDSALAASDWQGVNDTIRSILEKVDAEIVSVNKWDERKLAYDIRGKSRGTYILAYFRVDGSKVAEVERAARLSEDIMRVLILSVEGLDEKYIAKETPALRAERRASEDAEQFPGSTEFDEVERGKVRWKAPEELSGDEDTGQQQQTRNGETETQGIEQTDFFAELEGDKQQ
jgi:small subunit ribosomal protein S6